jgi:hypothetical protein
MALTAEQKATLATLKETIAEWKETQIQKIDDEFRFLASIRAKDSSLSQYVISDAVDKALEEIEQIQELLGGAYGEAS